MFQRHSPRSIFLFLLRFPNKIKILKVKVSRNRERFLRLMRQMSHTLQSPLLSALLSALFRNKRAVSPKPRSQKNSKTSRTSSISGYRTPFSAPRGAPSSRTSPTSPSPVFRGSPTPTFPIVSPPPAPPPPPPRPPRAAGRPPSPGPPPYPPPPPPRDPQRGGMVGGGETIGN